MKLIDNRFASNLNISVGDVLVCEYGELFIILHDEFDENYSYALASLSRLEIIEKHTTAEGCIHTEDGVSYIEGLKVKDIIPYDQITLTAGE